MNIFYRIETPNNISKLTDSNYCSCHHCDCPEVDGTLFYNPNEFNIENHDECHAGCGGYRISQSERSLLTTATDATPTMQMEYFCTELDGVCCFDSIKDLQSFISELGMLGVTDPVVVQFVGEQTGEVYDGLVARPFRSTGS